MCGGVLFGPVAFNHGVQSKGVEDAFGPVAFNHVVDPFILRFFNRLVVKMSLD